jgi:hypothetical protein
MLGAGLRGHGAQPRVNGSAVPSVTAGPGTVVAQREWGPVRWATSPRQSGKRWPRDSSILVRWLGRGRAAGSPC